MMTQHADLTIYSNASFKSGAAGYGYLAVFAGTIHIGSGEIPATVTNSFQAEVEAAELAMSDVLARIDGDAYTIDLVVSNGRVTEMYDQSRLWQTLAIRRNRTLSVFRVSPYESSSSGGSYANAVAHELAVIGRSGEIVLGQLELDLDWRDRVVAIDARLDPDDRPTCLDGYQAAELLGVTYGEIVELVRTGELSVEARSGRIPETSVLFLRESRERLSKTPRRAFG